MHRRNYHLLVLYDFSMARYIAEIVPEHLRPGFVLPGDSSRVIIEGQYSVAGSSMEDVLRYTRFVRAGLGSSSEIALAGDMPNGSHETPAAALTNATRFIEAGANIVKLECPVEDSAAAMDTITHLVSRGIEVIAHVGYLPQSGRQPRIAGKTLQEQQDLLALALGLERAGASVIALELMYAEVAQRITDALRVPTIAVAGTGPYCTGQAMNIYDILGLSELSGNSGIRWMPRPERPGAQAIPAWLEAVQTGAYPAPGQYHSLHGLRS